jgi:hypothetical protein
MVSMDIIEMTNTSYIRQQQAVTTITQTNYIADMFPSASSLGSLACLHMHGPFIPVTQN